MPIECPSPTSRVRRRPAIPAILIATLVVACLGSPARATENGLIEYPLGVDTVLPGLAPAPDHTTVYNYLEYYSADSFVNGSGKSVVPGFSESYTADALRILHTWKFDSGHFTFSSGVIPTLLNLNLAAGGRGQSATNLTDLVIQPMFANYTSTNHRLWALAGLGYTVPSGSYSKLKFANTGLHVKSVDTDAAITYFVDARTVASLKFVGEFSSTNPADQYHSGGTVNFDYSIEQAPANGSRFHYGLQGSASQQISNDTLDGQLVNGGNVGRGFMVGPQLRYDVRQGGYVLKYQHEFAVQNRAQGDHYWFEFAIPI